jgi:hypothetical protein
MAPDSDDEQSPGTPSGDFIACRLLARDGTMSEQVCIFDGSLYPFRMELSGEQGAYTFLRHAVERHRPRYQAVTKPLPEIAGAEDFVRLDETLADLEWKKDTYLAMPDLCLDAIPAQIAGAALRKDMIEPLLQGVSSPGSR